jgi:Na+/proline symporter
VLPDLGAAASGLRQPSEAAYVAMGMRVLPPGLVGVLLAAMLASSMASLSAVNHVVTGILAKDVYQSYARPLASEREMLVASRAASAAVGVATIGLALLFAAGARGVFTLLFVLESIFAIPVGLPILYGMVVRRGPRWAGAAAWAAGASTSLVTSLFLRERFGLNETYLIGVPAVATTAAFFASVALGRPKAAGASEVDRLFAKLAEPIDPATELAASPMSGRAQLAIVGRVTTAVGVASLLLVPASSAPRDRAVVLAYSALTALFGLGFLLASRTSRAAATRATVPASRPDEASNEA